jgi:hypothetical protein
MIKKMWNSSHAIYSGEVEYIEVEILEDSLCALQVDSKPWDNFISLEYLHETELEAWKKALDVTYRIKTHHLAKYEECEIGYAKIEAKIAKLIEHH